jgi:DNA polymerase-1
VAGTTFNINSPQQVGAVLFEKLRVVTDKKRRTATGRRSTAEAVLYELKDKHPVVPLILEYRESFKIKSAFIEPLLNKTGKDEKVRTTFLQTGTATGRISSEKPNLQNIPQTSKWAIPLRNCFEAKDGFSLLALDYSQLELRILSHVTKDDNLTQAFHKNQDIHRLTASKILKVPFDQVDQKMRRLGKTLNFGIVYGMGPRALSQTANLPLKEAEVFIEEYFLSFPAIKTWHEQVKLEAQTLGYVKNLNGRRRFFLDLAGGEARVLGEIERAAINMPIQSLAADILKLAMIGAKTTLQQKGWWSKQVKLLLSIHDELIFEVRDDILKLTALLLQKSMGQIYPLTVPLVVEASSGKSWGNLQPTTHA